MKDSVNIFWFRRDLRLEDNTALFHALQQPIPVIPIFIFDSNILNQLENKADKRVKFIHQQLENLQSQITKHQSTLQVFVGEPDKIFNQLLESHSVSTIFANEDYEPYAIKRDNQIKSICAKKEIDFKLFKDQVIFHKDEILKPDGFAYSIFTPYSKIWLQKLTPICYQEFESQKHLNNLYRSNPNPIPSLKSIGFKNIDSEFPSHEIDKIIIEHYQKNRDFPAINGTSKLSVHLRFGTISIRRLIEIALEHSASFLKELIWREFYQMILSNFPRVGKGLSFKPKYDQIEWEIDNGEFGKWCEGNTGYPIVDAGMRQLNQTGFMHNRVRMITASFLCKHLLLDWRLGEAYFAEKLLDYDFASNNGGWQWASSSGCDAAPYFRIFNPTIQMKKFDANFVYIKKWVPEFQDAAYPPPMIDHQFARERCHKRYAHALKNE